MSDAIVSWDTAGDQTQPCDVALGPLLDYAWSSSQLVGSLLAAFVAAGYPLGSPGLALGLVMRRFLW